MPEEGSSPPFQTKRFDKFRTPESESLKPRIDPRAEVETEEVKIVDVNAFDSKVREIKIVINVNHTIDIKSDDIFIAREMTKIKRSLEIWYRQSRRNYRINKNREVKKE